MTLQEIGEMHHTDKADYHKFCDFYEKQLPKSIDRLLEIGVLNGASLKMWRDYYPMAEIIGVDIKSPLSIEGVTCLQLDATKPIDLGDFDIIIDDGSHMTQDQQDTFSLLYPKVKDGGFYIMEDLHTSFRPDYINSKITTYEFLKQMDNVTYWSRTKDKTDSFTAVICKTY